MIKYEFLGNFKIKTEYINGKANHDWDLARIFKNDPKRRIIFPLAVKWSDFGYTEYTIDEIIFNNGEPEEIKKYKKELLISEVIE
jgi:hypothetical protein